MKKSSIILGASAVVLAIASAFTTKSNTMTLGTQGVVWTGAVDNSNCVPFTTFCTGGNLTSKTSASCTQGRTIFTKASGCHVILATRPS